MKPQNENREGLVETHGSLCRSDSMRLCLIPWFLRATMGALRVFTCTAFSMLLRLNLSADWLARGLFQTPRNKSPNYLSSLFRLLKMHLSHLNIGNYFPSLKDRKDPNITSGTQWNGPLASRPQELQQAEPGRQRKNETIATHKLFHSHTLQYKTIHNIIHNSLRNYGAQQSCGGLFARYSFEGF